MILKLKFIYVENSLKILRSQDKKKRNSTASKVYQPKENAPPKAEPIAPQRFRVLESSDSEEEAPDFDYLLKLPASTGSHFLLKSEQQRFNQDSDLEFSKHFHLDTVLLNLAMKSIPFNERQDIEGVEWNSTELQKMKEDASHFAELYREALDRSREDKKESIADIANKMNEVKIVDEAEQSGSFLSDKTTASKKPLKEKESMQEWLDDILDL